MGYIAYVISPDECKTFADAWRLAFGKLEPAGMIIPESSLQSIPDISVKERIARRLADAIELEATAYSGEKRDGMELAVRIIKSEAKRA